MIFDKITRLNSYLPFNIRKTITDFVNNTDVNAENGKYNLIGESIYAIVQDYDTLPRELCKCEAHKKYIDIQIMIDGSETIDVAEAGTLKAKEEYDLMKDTVFFIQPSESDYCSIELSSGQFVILFPYEAHIPKIAVSQGDSIYYPDIDKQENA